MPRPQESNPARGRVRTRSDGCLRMADSTEKRFEVRSARNAEFFRCDRPWAVISVSSGDQFPMLAGENRVGLLRLTFEDVTDKRARITMRLAVASNSCRLVSRSHDGSYNPGLEAGDNSLGNAQPRSRGGRLASGGEDCNLISRSKVPHESHRCRS